MTGLLYINSKDAFTTWGVILEDGGINTLLGSETMKAYTENENRKIAGKEVLIKNPKVEARSFVLTFSFIRKTALADFGSFFNELKAGRVVDGKIKPILFNVPALNKTYEFIYEARTSVTQLSLEMIKVSVKFNEPQP